MGQVTGILAGPEPVHEGSIQIDDRQGVRSFVVNRAVRTEDQRRAANRHRALGSRAIHGRDVGGRRDSEGTQDQAPALVRRQRCGSRHQDQLSPLRRQYVSDLMPVHVRADLNAKGHPGHLDDLRKSIARIVVIGLPETFLRRQVQLLVAESTLSVRVVEQRHASSASGRRYQGPSQHRNPGLPRRCAHGLLGRTVRGFGIFRPRLPGCWDPGGERQFG